MISKREGIINKICSKCRTEKPSTEFYKQRRKPDGLHAWCKSCCAEYKRQNQDRANARERERWATDPKYRMSRLNIQRRWIDKNREHKRLKEKGRRLRVPEEYRARAVRYANEHKEETRIMARARSSVYRAISCGSLKRPNKCEWCGTVCKPQAAHHDYSKPLDINWLCRPCHAKWDYHQPKIMGKVSLYV